jgi:hypothetical protein
MSDKAPEPEEKLTAASVFRGLLAFMDRPWKAIVVIVLLVLGGLGYILYLERGTIADAILHKAHEQAELDSPVFLRDADRLLRDTRADYALLIETNINDNILVDRVGVDRDGNRWIPSSGPQQALLPESSMPLVVKFLNNEVACVNAGEALNEDMKAMAVKGYRRVCLVAVPPILGVAVGGLALAWIQPLQPAAEERAALAMKAAALKFATW